MPGAPSRPPVVAVLGDVVRSRRMAPAERDQLQRALERLMTRINQRYEAQVLGDFLMTLGDEFQGILDVPDVVPDIVQDIREALPRLRMRIIASRGVLTTQLKPTAIGTDGPVWHAARDLLEEWRAGKREGLGFTGFGGDDVALNAISGLLTYHWSHLEDSQREIITALRHHEGLRKDAASGMRISQQAMSNRALTAGWREFEGGMEALRQILARHHPKTGA
ncbi:MAG TPA: SatD family protein [Gemmatimonadaceae bacterium]|nr:SatD family protein [Gemmatimonadaceae bacterium]